MASRKTWLIGVSFLVSGLILAFLLSQVKTSELTAAIAKANPVLLFAALLVSCVSMLLRAGRLHVLITSLKRDVPFSFVFLAQMAGMAASNFSPGRALEAAKVVPLKKVGVPYAQGALAVVWERVFDMLALVLLSFLVFARLSGDSRAALALFGVLVLAFSVLILTRAQSLLTLAARVPALRSLKGVKLSAFPKTTLASSFVLTVLAWVADALVFCLVFSALGLSFDLVILAGSFAASVLIGAISLLPAGLGSTEAALAFLLEGAAGLQNPALVAALLVGRIVSLGVSTVAGAVSVPLLARRVS